VLNLIFVDSSYIIALVAEKDQWHEDAVKNITKIEKREKVITETMVIESINLIGKCKGGKVGKTIFQYIQDNYTIYNPHNILKRAMEEFVKYDGTLSLADCTAIITIQDLGIREIISFDGDFDKVKGILRIK
jgi:predicted nucleic acid-binding protein